MSPQSKWIICLAFTSFATLFTNRVSGKIYEIPTQIYQLDNPIFDVADMIPNAKLSYADFVALRQDFPRLRSKSDAEISSLILRNFALMVRNQRRFDRVFQTVIPPSSSSRIIYRTDGAGRSGTVPFFEDPEGIYFPGDAFRDLPQDGFFGLVDLKGIGISPIDDHLTGHFVHEYFLGFLKAALNFGPRRSEWEYTALGLRKNRVIMEVYLDHFREVLEERRQNFKEAGALTQAEKTDRNHTLVMSEKDVQLFEISTRDLRSLTGDDYDAYIRLLRSRDYLNGLMPQSRTIYEIVMEREMRAFGIPTVKNYFFISIPVRGHMGEETFALSILGRQASHRYMGRDAAISSSFLPFVSSQMPAGVQVDIWERLIDFELIGFSKSAASYVDPRLVFDEKNQVALTDVANQISAAIDGGSLTEFDQLLKDLEQNRHRPGANFRQEIDAGTQANLDYVSRLKNDLKNGTLQSREVRKIFEGIISDFLRARANRDAPPETTQGWIDDLGLERILPILSDGIESYPDEFISAIVNNLHLMNEYSADIFVRVFVKPLFLIHGPKASANLLSREGQVKASLADGLLLNRVAIYIAFEEARKIAIEANPAQFVYMPAGIDTFIHRTGLDGEKSIMLSLDAALHMAFDGKRYFTAERERNLRNYIAIMRYHRLPIREIFAVAERLTGRKLSPALVQKFGLDQATKGKRRCEATF